MEINELIRLAEEKRLSGNFVEAEKFFLKAAELGSGHAAHELGILYKTGDGAIKTDHEKSQYWLEKSLASGFEETIASDPKWFRKST